MTFLLYVLAVVLALGGVAAVVNYVTRQLAIKAISESYRRASKNGRR